MGAHPVHQQSEDEGKTYCQAAAPTCRKMKGDTFLTSFTTMDSKLMKDLNESNQRGLDGQTKHSRTLMKDSMEDASRQEIFILIDQKNKY